RRIAVRRMARLARGAGSAARAGRGGAHRGALGAGHGQRERHARARRRAVVRWGGAAFGAAAFAAALIAFAPATLIDAQLERSSEGRFRLAGAQGTLWSGAGWIEILDAQGASGLAQPIAWRLAPWQLLRGRLVAEVALGDAAPFPITL